MARLSKIRKKKTSNPALDNIAVCCIFFFFMEILEKKRKSRKFTSPIERRLEPNRSAGTKCASDQ